MPHRIASAGLALVLSLGLGACGGDKPRKTTSVPAPPRAIDLGANPPTTPGGITSTATTPVPEPVPEPEPVVPRPRIVSRPIPFPPRRLRETALYAQRHYGKRSYRLRNPRVIVEHTSETDTAQQAYALFAPDEPDPELKELPNVCVHFLVDRNGRIFQLVPLGVMCRHTVGLNYTSIGIEHVAQSDDELLGNRRQLKASLALTRWLRCRYKIRLRDVIGHAESLSSPYHRERVARLRTQTHGDLRRAAMTLYRKRLARLPCY